jgi:hypothetical protein
MFNALHLDDASAELTRLLGWEIKPEIREDIQRYVKERSRYSLAFLEQTIAELPTEYALPLLDIAAEQMPRSRGIFVEILRAPSEPEIKTKSVKALHGTWKDPSEIRQLLVPLVKASHDELRINAIRGVADAAPQHIARVLGPSFTGELMSRPDEEVRELTNLYLQHGGEDAIRKFEELIHRRGLVVADSEQELAVMLAKTLARNTSPQARRIIGEVAKDWRVPGKIRNTCKELAQLMGI